MITAPWERRLHRMLGSAIFPVSWCGYDSPALKLSDATRRCLLTHHILLITKSRGYSRPLSNGPRSRNIAHKITMAASSTSSSVRPIRWLIRAPLGYWSNTLIVYVDHQGPTDYDEHQHAR